jgi:hypothetical protein
VVNTQTSTILGFEFENNSEPFAVFNIAQSIAVLVFALCETLIVNRKDFFVYTSVIGVIGIIFCGLTLLFKFKEHEDSEKPLFISKKNENDVSFFEYSSSAQKLDETIENKDESK